MKISLIMSFIMCSNCDNNQIYLNEIKVIISRGRQC